MTTASSQIVIGASIGTNTTNMFNQFAATPFTTLTLIRNGTNAVRLRGIVDQTLTTTIAGTWDVVTYSTNTTEESTVVHVPNSAEMTQNTVTNVFSLLTSDISTYSTNNIAPRATTLAHHANLTTTQTLSNKTVYNGLINDGTI